MASRPSQILPETSLRSTRGRILTAAERLFAERGFDSVSMPMIAKASGITAGAIYKHFASKADLLFEVVVRTVQSIRLPVADESPSDATSLPRVVSLYTTQRLKLLRQLALEIHSVSLKHPKIRRLLRQALDRDIQQIADAIVRAQQVGNLDPVMDPQLLASTLMVFVMGLMHMETLLPQRVDDPIWSAFVEERVATLLSLR